MGGLPEHSHQILPQNVLHGTQPESHDNHSTLARGHLGPTQSDRAGDDTWEDLALLLRPQRGFDVIIGRESGNSKDRSGSVNLR